MENKIGQCPAGEINNLYICEAMHVRAHVNVQFGMTH